MSDFRDGINDYLVHAKSNAVNPAKTGTKAAAHLFVGVPAEGSRVLRLRLSPTDLAHKEAFGAQFENGLQTRLREADEFYSKVIPPSLSSDEKLVMRQAFAGMLWSKQFYYYPVAKWLSDPVLPPDCSQRVAVRNKPWFHLVPIPLM